MEKSLQKVGTRLASCWWLILSFPNHRRHADKPKLGARYLLNHNHNDPEPLSKVGEYQV